jgi:hypothetical protein
LEERKRCPKCHRFITSESCICSNCVHLVSPDYADSMKTCRQCGGSKPLSKFYRRGSNRKGYRAICIECEQKNSSTHETAYYRRRLEQLHARGIVRPLSEAKDAPGYLGVYVAETVLSNYFDHVERMPTGDPGYDFLCSKGFKIDVKSACLNPANHRRTGYWLFAINQNSVADYFLCLAFDNRDNLNPLHLWLIPGYLISDHKRFSISEGTVAKWTEYEKPLDRVIACCIDLRDKANF